MVIGALAAVVWAHYLPGLWSLPQPNQVIPSDLQWSLWRHDVFITVLGLAAAVLAMRAARFWQVAILLTSGYLALLLLPHMVGEALKATTIEAWASRFAGLRAESVYYLLVVPLYHPVLAALVFAHLGVNAIASRQAHANAA
jgi:hypothetical protein